MAYDPSRLKLLGDVNDSARPRRWEYVSDDAMTTVRAANYIADAQVRGMQVGDAVRVITTAAGAVSTVFASTVLTVGASGADLADGSSETVTNS